MLSKGAILTKLGSKRGKTSQNQRIERSLEMFEKDFITLTAPVVWATISKRFEYMT